ncbi:MAG TPA: hypothetical protein VFB34_08750 [Chloroflexota bacterium]|nr:hypothetical protein [Chloroflexota bacterium]
MSDRTSNVSPPAAPVPARLPRWLPPVVILGALGVGSLAFGALFAPQTLLASGQHMTEAARVWSRYAAAYSFTLCLTILFLLAIRARRLLAGVLVQATFAELILVIVAIANKRWEQIPADIVLAVVFVASAFVLFGQPVWHLAAWRDDSRQ